MALLSAAARMPTRSSAARFTMLMRLAGSSAAKPPSVRPSRIELVTSRTSTTSVALMEPSAPDLTAIPSFGPA